MPLIEDIYSDTVGRIRFPLTSSLDYEAISIFYKITGAVPYSIEEHPDFVIHTVRLRSLPSLIPMGLSTATVPTYGTVFQTDNFEDGITRVVIRDADLRCVVRYEKDSAGWSTFAFDKPPLRFYTD